MSRIPDQCSHRVPHQNAPSAHVHCEILRQRCELPPEELCWVPTGACVACCCERESPESCISPVIASLMLTVLSSSERAASWSVERRQKLTSEATERLDFVGTREPHRPLAKPKSDASNKASPVQTGLSESQKLVADSSSVKGSNPQGQSAAGAAKIVWAIGLLTAPREHETLTRSLHSLKKAGFEDVQLFAEPDSTIPAEFQHLKVTQHGRTLGIFGNTMSALISLYSSNPNATAFALFQDDIGVAEGLKAWCEQELWPDDHGLVSLFTIHEQATPEPGWHVAHRGFYRTFGALGFVFRRDVLLEFLSDHKVWSHRLSRPHANDAAIGEWATRTGRGIAYHSPSLLQHVGATSTVEHVFNQVELAHAVPHVRDIRTWKRPPRQVGRVGLVGWNTASGLGYVNRELATHFPIDRWIAPRHPRFPTLAPLDCCRTDIVDINIAPPKLREWLVGLDWVLFAELPYIERFAQHARDRAIRVACIPMWEWLHPKLEWLNYVDLMICPTRFTFDRLTEWKRQFGFCWDIITLPWPVDLSRFSFQQRRTCERFLFVNGTGGGHGLRPDGTKTPYRRKGAELVAETARLLPDVPFLWYSQVDDIPSLPPNVQRRQAPDDSARLYDEGDVCIQPSSWEGIGLQLLECQAAGMPLVTTDAAPMNEFRPLRAVQAAFQEPVRVYGPDPITSHVISPTDLAATLRELLGTDLTEASHAARQFVEQHHSWAQANEILREHLFGLSGL